MRSLLGFLHTLGLTLWVGGLFFLHLVVTPSLHGLLSDDLAGRAVRHVQRAYYLFAAACGGTSLFSLVAMAGLGLGDPRPAWRAGLLALMLGLTAVAGSVLEPRLDRERSAVPDFDPRGGENPHLKLAERYHRLCVQVNGTVLLMGLICLWLSAGGGRA